MNMMRSFKPFINRISCEIPHLTCIFQIRIKSLSFPNIKIFNNITNNIMFSLNLVCFSLIFLSAYYVPENKVNGQEIQLPPGQECQMTPVIHVLQHPGCVPKPIPSYACIGKCTSYVQVSGSKIWQMERSCNCCQESGEREATVVLFCPKAKSDEKRFRKVSTKAPLECMCRPCGTIDESSIIPQEIAGYADESLLQSHFRKSL